MTRLRHRARVIEALVLLLLARALRRTVPMRRWSWLLGPTGPATVSTRPSEPIGPTQPTQPTATPAPTERAVAHAVHAAARRLHANCLEQAVAASLMLSARRERSVVVVGLSADNPASVPHAWLVGRSGSVLTGADEAAGFRPVSQFGRLPAARP